MTQQPTTGLLSPETLETLDPAPVEEALRALAAALRSYRLYEGANPMVDRFVEAAGQRFGALWETVPSVRLDIEEHAIRWEGHVVLTGGDGGTDLPFIFYKDGIRELTIEPGFEDGELLTLLGVLSRAPAVREEEDDLLTLLWQVDFAHLRYAAVEAGIEGIEGVELGGKGNAPAPIDAAAVREEQASTDTRFASTEDFQETLYFLDDAELRILDDEIRREAERDVWGDVVNALFDRLEDGDPDRQVRIINIIAELLPSAMASGRFDRAVSMVEELVELAGRANVLAPSALLETRKIFDILASEEAIVQLVDLLEASPDQLSGGFAERLLALFPPRAIAPLMRVTERIEKPAVKRAFESCLQRLAESNREKVAELLRSEEPAVIVNALRWVGRLEIGSASADTVRFLRHPDPELRVAAIDTLVALRAAAAGSSLIPLLEDPERDVRIAAARAIGNLGFGAGRSALEAALGSKRLREADRTEKIAFFEAFGRIGDQGSVEVLDRILNAKGWLNRGEPTEMRACAAIALGRIRHPAARQSLEKAANDSDPVVRSAVARAIRGEAE